MLDDSRFTIHGSRVPLEWDPDFLDRSPLLECLSARAAPLRCHREWPSREALQQLIAVSGASAASGARLHLVPPSAALGSYESQVYSDGAMQLREGEWHDLFNVLVWLTYPKSKAALNYAHHVAIRSQPQGTASGSANRRGRVRDALTVLDESGAVVVSSDPDLLEDVQAFRWKRLFWERRTEVQRSMRFYLFGHALFEKALNPYVGMTAHAMLVEVSTEFIAAPLAQQLAGLDECMAHRIPALSAPHMLAPLPLLGVPGWWSDNERETFYDDAAYFRAGRTMRR